jgi:hypothetical protein
MRYIGISFFKKLRCHRELDEGLYVFGWRVLRIVKLASDPLFVNIPVNYEVNIVYSVLVGSLVLSEASQ